MQDLLGRTMPACDRAMYSAVVSGRIRGFACKEQSIFNRIRQSLLCAVCTDRSITISPARKRIALPVVEIGGLERSA